MKLEQKAFWLHIGPGAISGGELSRRTVMDVFIAPKLVVSLWPETLH